jgi:acyl-CoA synthetase (AMP-forming)/AMP-acid ligase II
MTSTDGAPPDTLAALISRRAGSPGTTGFLRHARSPRELSTPDLLAHLHHVAGWLDRHHVDAGARVVVDVADPVDFALVTLTTIASGRWAATLDPHAPDRVAIATRQRLRPALVVSDRPPDPGTSVPWVPAAELAGTPVEVAPFGPDAAPVGELGPPAGGGHGSGGGAILLSSGSTGTPKVITLHQSQLLHAARSVAAHHRLSPADTGFNPLPLFHINAQVVGVLAALVSGAVLVLDDRFHRTQFWKLMDQEQVTWINAVPAIIARLAEPEPDETVPSRIRFVRSASAPLPTATLHRFEQATGLTVIETYGMTEAASQITATPLDGPRKPGSVGVPVGIELRIVDTGTGSLLGPSPDPAPIPGHVEIRGPAVDPPDGTSLAEGPGGNPGRIGGWLRTGDLGYLDQDGYLYLAGRKDDVINRGGEKMFPREIEEVILEDPRVDAVVVVGEDDDALGQVPVAYLTARGSGDPAGSGGRVASTLAREVAIGVRDHLRLSLPDSRHPVAIHVVTTLPRTATGKLLRRSIRRDAIEPVVTLELR